MKPEHPPARTLVKLAAAMVTLAACSGTPAAMHSPSSSAVVASPSPAQLAPGGPAWVAVSVASGWRSPTSPRAVDAAALRNPVEIRAWLDGMSASDRVGLIDRLDTQLLLGDEVLVLEVDGDWARVSVPDQSTPLDARGYPVWIPVRQLTALPPPVAKQTLTVVEPTTYLRSAGAAIEVSFGTTLTFLGTEGTLDVVGVPGGATMTVESSAVALHPMPATATSILALARRFIGIPYLWGGTSGFGFDCSGLVHLLYKALGVTLPRDSDPQSQTGALISRSSLQPGDLVFFSRGGTAYHVAIYSGAGMIIDSPSPGYAVEEVPLASMSIIADYSGARRVLLSPPAG